VSSGRRVAIAALAWLAMLGADLVLNAAVFARLYLAGAGDFMLPAGELFRRIPLGYAAFLILAALTVELAWRLRVRTAVGGLAFGLAFGGAVAGAWSLGLVSVSTIPLEYAITFAFVWMILVGVAGFVAGTALAGRSMRRLSIAVVVFAVACLVSVMVLQSSGLVPVVRL